LFWRSARYDKNTLTRPLFSVSVLSPLLKYIRAVRDSDSVRAGHFAWSLSAAYLLERCMLFSLEVDLSSTV
jgi:hypothetical protein